VARIAAVPTSIGPVSGLSQSSVIVAALAAGFVLYLAVKGRLGVYWSLLAGTSVTTPATGTAPPSALQGLPIATPSTPAPSNTPIGV
jgi:hypothetical protein